MNLEFYLPKGTTLNIDGLGETLMAEGTISTVISNNDGKLTVVGMLAAKEVRARIDQLLEGSGITVTVSED